MTAFEVAHHGQFLSSWGIDQEGLGIAFHLLVMTTQVVVSVGLAWWAWGVVFRYFRRQRP